MPKQLIYVAKIILLMRVTHIYYSSCTPQQHSRAFVANFLPIVASVIRETICDDVKRKPFGITADKITTQSRTRHIFGIRISQLSNTATEKCAEDVYLSHV